MIFSERCKKLQDRGINDYEMLESLAETCGARIYIIIYNNDVWKCLVYYDFWYIFPPLWVRKNTYTCDAKKDTRGVFPILVFENKKQLILPSPLLQSSW